MEIPLRPKEINNGIKKSLVSLPLSSLHPSLPGVPSLFSSPLLFFSLPFLFLLKWLIVTFKKKKLIKHSLLQVLSCQHVINIKIINELFFHSFVFLCLLLSVEIGVRFALLAHLNSDLPCFQCSEATYGLCQTAHT